MPVRLYSHIVFSGKLALVALALSACAAPAAVPPTAPPTAAPTEPPTATALPPTDAATPQSTQAGAGNAPVPAKSVALNGTVSLAVDAQGNLYVSTGGCGCPGAHPIYKIDTFGLLTIFANAEGKGDLGDGGPALSAGIAGPAGLAFDAAGNLYVADVGNNRIRRVDRQGTISTVAGSGATSPGDGSAAPGNFGGDGGPATAARLWGPTDIAFDTGGNLYIYDAGNSRVRKVDQRAIITTVAGNGQAGFSGDGGPATAAQLTGGSGLALDADGNLYIADGDNNRVRKVDKQGIITTIAGNGGPAISGDGGPATAATLSRPAALAFDAGGNLYIAATDSTYIFDTRIRKVDKNGIITTVVGTGVPGFSGDGGPAAFATIRSPGAMAFDHEGNLYLTDTFNARIRKVDRNGIITTVAGGVF